MKKIRYVEGINGVVSGIYAGLLNNVHTLLTDEAVADEKDTRTVLEFEEKEAEEKLAELQALFPNAKFELVDAEAETKAEEAKAGN